MTITSTWPPVKVNNQLIRAALSHYHNQGGCLLVCQHLPLLLLRLLSLCYSLHTVTDQTLTVMANLNSLLFASNVCTVVIISTYLPSFPHLLLFLCPRVQRHHPASRERTNQGAQPWGGLGRPRPPHFVSGGPGQAQAPPFCFWAHPRKTLKKKCCFFSLCFLSLKYISPLLPQYPFVGEAFAENSSFTPVSFCGRGFCRKQQLDKLTTHRSATRWKLLKRLFSAKSFLHNNIRQKRHWYRALTDFAQLHGV